MADTFCKECGSKLEIGAKFCAKCGRQALSEAEAISNKKVKANDHESYGTYSLLSVLLPGVGVILGIVFLAKDKPVDKKLGEHLIAVGVLSFILWGVIYSVFAPGLFSTPTIYNN